MDLFFRQSSQPFLHQPNNTNGLVKKNTIGRNDLRQPFFSSLLLWGFQFDTKILLVQKSGYITTYYLWNPMEKMRDSQYQLALVQDVFPSTVCSAIILLMEEILHHLGWLKPYKWWDNHHPWWCRILSINSLTQSPPFWPHKSITLAWYAANCCVPRAAAAKAMAVYPKIRVALMIIMGPAWDRHINICREGTEG